uniref:Putative RNA-directed DNA polymerase n=2 Tax=Sipha flava TaxID=143950 RepID=A0A2S2PX53_9HEMI
MNGFSTISPPGPTYWPTHSNRQPDLLDFFISSIPNHINHTIQNICDLSSDHSPVLLKIMELPTLTPSCPSLSKGPINWKQFSSKLENSTNLKISLKTCNEIESAAHQLVKSIQSAVYECSYPSNQKCHSNLKSFILPPNINILIAEKRRARSRWQRSRLPSDKSAFNNLSNTIKKLIQKYKNDLFVTKFKFLNTQDGTLWKTTKNMLKLKEFSCPIEKADGSLALSDLDKAKLFGEHLSNIFKPHLDITPSTTQLAKIKDFLDAPLPMSLPIKHVSPYEVANLIQRLKPNKSPGHDLITNKILKYLPKKTILLLTFLFNSMLRLSYFPTIWKLSIVILILKPGKPTNIATSYRPISLLPVIGKLFEKIILKRLRPIIESHKIIPDAQFGFRAHHSTIQQVHRLVDKISSSFENKNYCPAVFLDVAQAFDRVWHNGLLYKLKLFLPAPLYLLIRSYLENRTFKVRQSNSFSSVFPILAGVPQGSDLSPDLYNIFSSDIPQTNDTIIATYADDTAILSSNKNPTVAFNALQNHLDLIDNWSSNWKIKINADKSVHVPFTLNKKNLPTPTLHEIPIPSSSQVKYLGIILDKRLTSGPHLKNKRKSLNSRLHLLRPILKSKLPLHNKLILYKAMLRPIWSYGAQIWGCAKPPQLETIEAFQSISLHTITSAPWYISNHTLHKDLNIEAVDNLVKTYYKKFHSKLFLHPNPLIANQHTVSIPDNPPPPPRPPVTPGFFFFFYEYEHKTLSTNMCV